MTKRWPVSLMAGIAIWLGFASIAQAAVAITPEPGGTGTVTLSILASGGADITDDYLPTWTPAGPLQTVYIVVNGAGTPSLVDTGLTPTLPLTAGSGVNPFRAVPTTSRFPGNCTNYGDNADRTPDFELGGATTIPGTAITGYPLISKDCGGMAVIQVGSDTFVVPRDLNANGIPDFLETLGVTLIPGADNDSDGISNFDELRGFIISGQHVPTNPTIKDLFVHLVRPQCGTPSLLKGGPVVYPTSGTLDGDLQDLIPVAVGKQVRFLGSSLPSSPGSPSTTLRTQEWVDQFSAFFLSGSTETWTYCTLADCGAGSTTFNVTMASGTPPTEDRVINKNRVYEPKQKGLRLTECVDATLTSPFGTQRYSATATGRDEGVVYTKRIENYVNAQGSATAKVYYSTFNDATATWDAPAESTRAAITSEILKYIVAMEIAHGAKLNQEFLSSTFPHYTAGTGNALDASFRVSTRGSPSGVKFWIPKAFGATDQSLLNMIGP